jgi:hypothetical protein
MRNLVFATILLALGPTVAQAGNGTLVAPPNASPAVHAPYLIPQPISAVIKKLVGKKEIVDGCGHFCRSDSDCGNGCDCAHGSLCGTGMTPDGQKGERVF